MNEFDLALTNLSWWNGASDDPRDLCLHGTVTGRIGKRAISCTPKILPEDEIDRRGYEAFWREFRRRRDIKQGSRICPIISWICAKSWGIGRCFR